ncbi:MAG TPA: DUF4383 domain-containing protein [Methylocystis sp.]|nr:DUF4383 domain-containing protein [Methylocystis sp.]
MIERRWTADLLATIFGLIFLAVGLLGFTNNPIVSAIGFFAVNDAHNWVHVASGLIFLAGAVLRIPAITIRVMAALYLIVAITGFVITDRMMFGLVEMNVADRWLHLAIAAVLLFVGFMAPARESVRPAHL